MSLEVDIKKKFKGFCLDVNFKTEDHSLGYFRRFRMRKKYDS